MSSMDQAKSLYRDMAEKTCQDHKREENFCLEIMLKQQNHKWEKLHLDLLFIYFMIECNQNFVQWSPWSLTALHNVQ